MNKRIPSLDGLRAIAVLFVVLGHLNQKSDLPDFFAKAIDLFVYAQLGVTMFFVISGFLITSLLINERRAHHEINVKKFYVRRFLRILPICYLYVFFILVMNGMYNLGIGPGQFIHALTYTTNFALVSTWFLNHTWTLGVEEQFYLIWPHVVSLSKKKIIVISMAIIFLSAITRSLSYAFPFLSNYILAPFLNHAGALMVGSLSAVILEAHPLLGASKGFLRILKYVLCPFVMWFIFYMGAQGKLGKVVLPFGHLLVSISFALLILDLIREGKSLPYRILNSAPLVFLGKLSYSIYIWQQLILFQYTQFPANMGILVLVSALSYYFWENPIRNLGHRE